MTKLSNTTVPIRVSLKFDKTLRDLQKELSEKLGSKLTIRQVTEFLANDIMRNKKGLKKCNIKIDRFGFIK